MLGIFEAQKGPSLMQPSPVPWRKRVECGRCRQRNLKSLKNFPVFGYTNRHFIVLLFSKVDFDSKHLPPAFTQGSNFPPANSPAEKPLSALDWLEEDSRVRS